eukprot:TRINITY_DN20124_c0_g3_i1.p1 TRINITY_DN20124_c0_g3~~TRINITY_DN20124_c0_g3_i1.p1  ORF type:complete len:650 (-),score=111.02 TRINITY_DN20124_c0_g3_i1:101-2050(-)
MSLHARLGTPRGTSPRRAGGYPRPRSGPGSGSSSLNSSVRGVARETSAAAVPMSPGRPQEQRMLQRVAVGGPLDRAGACACVRTASPPASVLVRSPARSGAASPAPALLQGCQASPGPASASFLGACASPGSPPRRSTYVTSSPRPGSPNRGTVERYAARGTVVRFRTDGSAGSQPSLVRRQTAVGQPQAPPSAPMLSMASPLDTSLQRTPGDIGATPRTPFTPPRATATSSSAPGPLSAREAVGSVSLAPGGRSSAGAIAATTAVAPATSGIAVTPRAPLGHSLLTGTPGSLQLAPGAHGAGLAASALRPSGLRPVSLRQGVALTPAPPAAVTQPLPAAAGALPSAPWTTGPSWRSITPPVSPRNSIGSAISNAVSGFTSSGGAFAPGGLFATSGQLTGTVPAGFPGFRLSTASTESPRLGSRVGLLPQSARVSTASRQGISVQPPLQRTPTGSVSGESAHGDAMANEDVRSARSGSNSEVTLVRSSDALEPAVCASSTAAAALPSPLPPVASPVLPLTRSEAGTGGSGSADDTQAVLIQDLLRTIASWRQADGERDMLRGHREEIAQLQRDHMEAQTECGEFKAMVLELSRATRMRQEYRDSIEEKEGRVDRQLRSQNEEIRILRSELEEAQRRANRGHDRGGRDGR